jgi:transcriptional regulator with XRE-family HTH domain
MNATALTARPPRDCIPFVASGMHLAVTTVGFEVGTGGAATLNYIRERGNRGYRYSFVPYDCSNRTYDITPSRTPAEDIEHIRGVLRPAVTDLAEVLGVSRQALYDWQSGKSVAPGNASRLADLARAADVFAIEGMIGMSSALRRPIRNGKNFFDLVREGGCAEDTAQTLAEIVRGEIRQRQALKVRLARRKRPAREAFEEVGAPMLDEKG